MRSPWTGVAIAALLAGPANAAPPCDLAPSSGVGTPDLLIAEIAPGSHIVLYNTTDQAIDLDASEHQLCSPFDYVAIATLEAGTIEPLGRVILPWPAFFQDGDSGGEVILYSAASFSNYALVEDFVCWGTNPHGSRKSGVESAGKWQGTCAPALEQGAIQRLAGTTGTDAASYDTSQEPAGLACPEPGATLAGIGGLAALACVRRIAVGGRA